MAWKFDTLSGEIEWEETVGYKTGDTEGILPIELHKAAIEFAKEKTGIRRPVKEHRPYIDSFTACFKLMQELDMVSEKYKKEK
ncbi:MAG TPA: hypothetical protein VMT62_15205 [Syntrophorhabdaceae bacterium]|nr:hypothetical protein [Syntrophorhabdaceae bacterium]